MTASRQRLVSAIRDIAKRDPDIANAIAKTSNKGGQPGSSSSASSGGEESRICCDGSTSGNANPGNNQRNPDDEGAGQDGLEPDDPANLDMGGGSLTGVTDCATGQPICFEGSDWIPPDGWDDPQSPPVDDTFEQGYFWVRYGNISGALCCSAAFTKSGTLANQEANCDGETAPLVARQECGQPVAGVLCEIPNCFDPDPSEYTVNTWPEDGCVNLAIKGGKIVGSKFDPENDGSYNTPMAELTLCDGSGNQVNIKASAGGGWKSINGTTGEDGYLYNAQGEQIAHIDGNEYNDPLI